MPTAVIDGIPTRYEVTGSGPALLMFSPGGFDSSLEGWRTVGVYRRLRLLDHLARNYTCVTFDRRESGRSGGRLERISWADYVRQGVGLLDHLGIERAHLMGGCVGCSTRRIRGRPPRAGAEHGAVLARGRGEVPDETARSIPQSCGVRRRARTGAGGVPRAWLGRRLHEGSPGRPWAR